MQRHASFTTRKTIAVAKTCSISVLYELFIKKVYNDQPKYQNFDFLTMAASLRKGLFTLRKIEFCTVCTYFFKTTEPERT